MVISQPNRDRKALGIARTNDEATPGCEIERDLLLNEISGLRPKTYFTPKRKQWY